MQRITTSLKRLFTTQTNIDSTSAARLAAVEAHIAAGGSVYKNNDGTWELLGNTMTDTQCNNTVTTQVQLKQHELLCHLNKLQPHNIFIQSLPGDQPPDHTVSQYNVPHVCYSYCTPTPFTQPSTLCSISAATAKLLNITLPNTPTESEQLALYFSGNNVFPQCINSTWSARYAGHQFHQFAGQLGDGRAITLLQTYINNQLYELQLKGAGKTPYSRGFDGRAVLRSSIREYLMCEHMHALRIPTTRALTLCVNNDKVRRQGMERCAVVCRIAQSFIRFGSFEIHYYADEYKLLQQLADYTIKHFYSDIDTLYPYTDVDALNDSKPLSKRYAKLIELVTIKTAQLIAHWQSVYFIHSVMNTDNMSIIGITIDYAPPSLLCDEYRASYISNDTDDTGMYSYENQPKAAKFNLDKLAKCFTVLCHNDDLLHGINQFDTVYEQHYTYLMKQKLGLQQSVDTDTALIQSLMTALSYTHGVDYTYFFRNMFNTIRHDDTTYTDVLTHAGVSTEYHALLIDWCQQYTKRLHQEKYSNDTERHTYCNQYNSQYILRAYLLDEAYNKAVNDDYTMINDLLQCMTAPYDYNDKYAEWSRRPPEYYSNLTCSCSS